MAADHPLATKKALRLADVAHELFVMLSPDRYPMANHCIHALCSEHGFVAQVAQHANDYQSLQWLVSVGIGITIAADSLRHCQREGMIWCPIKDTKTKSPMLMIQRGDNASPALKLFRQTVQAETRNIRSKARIGHR
jgi:DNA-binding transcriptional LysR family regulator